MGPQVGAAHAEKYLDVYPRDLSRPHDDALRCRARAGMQREVRARPTPGRNGVDRAHRVHRSSSGRVARRSERDHDNHVEYQHDDHDAKYHDVDHNAAGEPDHHNARAFGARTDRAGTAAAA